MQRCVDHYSEVSESPAKSEADFDRILTKIPLLSSDPKTAVTEVMDALKKEGFNYRHDKFTLQDVLEAKGGNCLGLPLFVGCILAERGFIPAYRAIVTPKDFVFHSESRFFQRLLDETPYDRPALATSHRDTAIYRFSPLEHLVLDVDGGILFEITSQQHDAPECETSRSISFKEALSYIHKDRALGALRSGSGDAAKSLCQQGLLLWNKNRELYQVLGLSAVESFDDYEHRRALEKYNEIGGDDSLYHMSMFMDAGEQAHLTEALQRYPAFAHAIAQKAQLLISTDPREARFLYAIASHLVANSAELRLPRFCTAHHDGLAEIFPPRYIQDILEGFGKESWGNFDYHIALYKLSKKGIHLAEAGECCQTPFQQAIFLAQARGTKHFNHTLQRGLDDRFRNSQLYQQLQKDLYTSKE